MSDRVPRREVLGLSGTALVSVAGCTRGVSNSAQQNTPSPTASEREYAHSVDTPDSITVRNPGGEPAVRSPAHSPEEDMFESAAAWDYEDWLLTSPKDRELLDFSRGTSHVGAAKEFMAGTDLSETTLLIHQYDIGTCETRRLIRLEWDAGFSCGDRECVGISLHYEPTDRDGECQAADSDGGDGPPYSDESHANEATFVRIPTQMQTYGRLSVQV